MESNKRLKQKADHSDREGNPFACPACGKLGTALKVKPDEETSVIQGDQTHVITTEFRLCGACQTPMTLYFKDIYFLQGVA